jgi:hypothetical protein
MYSDPLAIDQMINIAKQKSESLNKRSPLLRDFRSWSKWIKTQRDLFLKGRIASHEFHQRSTAFAMFIKSKMGISSEETEDLLNFGYCPGCLEKLSDADKNRRMCANCRRRLALSYDEDFDIPPRMDFLYSLTLLFQIFIYPKKAFQYIKYGLSNWIQVLLVFVSSSLLLAYITSLIVPRITYPAEDMLRSWWDYQNKAIFDVALGYTILNLLMILVFSGVIYLFAIGASYYQSPLKTIQITSFILIPRMIILPLFALLHQFSNPQTFLLPRFRSFEEAKWLLLNLSDFMGTMGVFVQPITAALSCILLVFALKYTWGLDMEAAAPRAVLLGCIFVVIILGVPIYI